MLRHLRSARHASGLLILAAFAAWIGLSAFHHHPTTAPCEVCKVLHATHASLPGGVSAPEPDLAAGQTAPTVPDVPPEPQRLHAQSRAPPLA